MLGREFIEEFHDDGGIVIQATDQGIAEKTGKEIEKVFKGNLKIIWLNNSKFVRVIYERN